MPPQIKANDPTKTLSANLTTMSRGFFVFGSLGGIAEHDLGMERSVGVIRSVLGGVLRRCILSLGGVRQSGHCDDSISLPIEIENANTLGVPSDFADIINLAA